MEAKLSNQGIPAFLLAAASTTRSSNKLKGRWPCLAEETNGRWPCLAEGVFFDFLPILGINSSPATVLLFPAAEQHQIVPRSYTDLGQT